MKANWIIVCLFLLLSLSAYAGKLDITIDAEKDAYYNTLTGPDDGWVWIPSEAYVSANGEQPADDYDFSANWYSAWDSTYLYVYDEVSDDFPKQDNASNYWANDCFDAKMDPDFTATSTSEVFCFAMTCMDSIDVDESMFGAIGNIVETVGGGWILGTDSTAYKSVTREDYARNFTDTGYILECRVKWEWIATTSKGPIYPLVGDVYGFAIMHHDNDYTASREGSIGWAANVADNVWTDCTYHGYIELLDDHKIKYVAENLRDSSIYHPDPDIYIPTIGAVSEKSTVAKDFALSQNYPNPFNPTTTIAYALKVNGKARLSVYDLTGKEVAVLVDGIQSAGNHEVQFTGADLTSGIYFYKLQTAEQVITRKMTLIK